MKKLILVLALVLVGCGSATAANKVRTLQNDSNVQFVKDEETECQYVFFETYGTGKVAAITPRLNRFGKPMCGKE